MSEEVVKTRLHRARAMLLQTELYSRIGAARPAAFESICRAVTAS